MKDDQPLPPVYSDRHVNIYVGKSQKELQGQQRAQWARELAEGSISPEDLAYRLRQLATNARHWDLIPCDQCGAPGERPFCVFGSPLGVLKYIENHLGLAVPGGREALLKMHAGSGLEHALQDFLAQKVVSSRVLVFCAVHAPSDELVIEPGFKEEFKKFYKEKLSE